MNITIDKKYLDELGFKEEVKTRALFGYFAGYPVFVEEHYRGEFTLTTAVKSDGEGPDHKTLKAIEKQGSALINLAAANRFQLSAWVKYNPKEEDGGDRLLRALKDLTAYLQAEGWEACCQENGETDGLQFYNHNGELAILSPSAYAQHLMVIEKKGNQAERVWLGLLGSFLAGAVGVALAVFAAYHGYVVGLLGFVIGLLTILGYRLLARKFSIKGLLFILPVLALLLLITHELDTALFLIRGQKLVNIWKYFLEIRGNFPLDKFYWANLAILSGTALFGAGLVAFFLWKKSKKQVYIERVEGAQKIELGEININEIKV